MYGPLVFCGTSKVHPLVFSVPLSTFYFAADRMLQHLFFILLPAAAYTNRVKEVMLVKELP